MTRIVRGVVAAGALLVAAAAPAAWDDTAAEPSASTPQEQAAALDRRVIELQHEILAARHNGDQAAVERAQQELKSVQTQRLDALRNSGQLP
jgi:hypothetical protein